MKEHGYVKIDGEDITSLDLDILRKKISVIPQFNLIMSGTLRSNIDPKNEITDDDMIELLKKFEVFYLLSKSNKNNNKEESEKDKKSNSLNDLSKLTVSIYVNFFKDIEIKIKIIFLFVI